MDNDEVDFARDVASVHLLVMVGYTHDSAVNAIKNKDLGLLAWSGRTPSHLV